MGAIALGDLWPLLAVALPFLGILFLVRFMNRWGAKHDPMSGSARNLWSIKSRQSRGEWHED